jgi:DMSO/TMAO reductase YedYZ molybdopterin-dependent catalytic subunit
VRVTVEPIWSITIVAARGATVEFTDLDAAKMTPVTLDVELRGRGGAVTRDAWTGVPLKDILAKKGITGYTGSTIEGADGFKAEYTLAVMDRAETIVVWLRNDQPMKPLEQEGDGPVRIVPKGEPGRMFVRNLVKITLHF